MSSPTYTDLSSIAPRSSYTTLEPSSAWSDSQSSCSRNPLSHRSSFLDLSPDYPAPDQQEHARSRTRIYTPVPGSTQSQTNYNGTPSMLPCERLGLAESYTLSRDQLVQLVSAVQQLSAPPQTNSAPPSHARQTLDQLQEEFDFVRGEMLRAVITHTLEEDELHKLDSDRARSRGRVSFDRYGRGFDAQGTSTHDYPTLESVVDPLTTYFRVLLAALSSLSPSSPSSQVAVRALADGSHQYLARLTAFAGKYEWAAVLRYHFDFHRFRLCEMRMGEYGGWGAVDVGLHARHLAGREKGWNQTQQTQAQARPAPTPATAIATAWRRNTGPGAEEAGVPRDGSFMDFGEGRARTMPVCEQFNRGSCAEPCHYGRAHRCGGCGARGHSLVCCPSSRVVLYTTDDRESF